MSVLSILRRIRACESEVAAQVILEHALHNYGEEVRKKAAEIADAHECGGDDDITCRGQNCGMIIYSTIEKMELP